ncbi:MAG: hypothetical protein M1839_001136 [Geoglossum umbratile]|nr:MAG: hypothetical protein M1839_001136 [Geoglossum umbratile]
MNHPTNYKDNCVVIGHLTGETDTGELVHIAIGLSGETLVGRDPKHWYDRLRAVNGVTAHAQSNYVLSHAAVSNVHLRIYCIGHQFDEDPPFVYCEDLSRNGTLWNSVAIGKGKGAVLLSEGDHISVCGIVNLTFNQSYEPAKEELDEIQEAEKRLFADRYIITNRKLGMGGYGSVYLAINQQTKRQLACKIVNLHAMSLKEHAKDIKHNQKDMEASQKWYDRWTREVEILQSLNHPHIIDLEAVFRSERTIYIFEELVTGGDLFSYATAKGPLRDTEVALIVRQIVKGLEYLHAKGIAHRDLKPDNILITSPRVGSRILLADFDSARAIKDIWSKRMKTLIGTPAYVAPEVYSEGRTTKGMGYTESIDMHSLGVMTAVLLTGVSYWPEWDSPDESKAASSCECILRRLESNEEEWRDVGPRAKDFVGKLIVVDAGKRMTARQALQHHWFTNEAHRGSYQRLYERAVKNWEPRTRCANIIEDISLPIPNLGAVASSTKGAVPSYFKDPPKVLPRVVQTTREPLWSPVSEKREFPGNLSDSDSSAAVMRAPMAIMYVTRGRKPPAGGSTLTHHQCQAGEVTTRGYGAYLSATRQALQGQKKRGRAAQHQGEHGGYPGAGKRAKKPAITNGGQGVTRMRSPNARS